jgi:diaminopimelate dehydrogenase
MEKIRVAVVGYGNIGQYTLEAIEASPDMVCVGVVRRVPSKEGFPELAPYPVVSDIREL